MVYSRAMPTFRFRSSLLLALSLAAFAPTAIAQADAPATEQAPAKTKKRAKAPKKATTEGGPVAFFTGFRKLPDGGSRIFVDLSERVQVTKRDGVQELTYSLRGARLASKNNQNALVTEHFETQVARAKLVPTEDGLELVIQLREDAKPAHRLLRREGDVSQLQIDFPPSARSEAGKDGKDKGAES